MEYFTRSYEILSLGELTSLISRTEPLPRKAVVITFDDGYKDNYQYAYPILKKLNIPAIVFLATGHIGTGKLFWWERIRYIIENTAVTQIDLGEIGKYPLDSMVSKKRSISIIVERLKKLPERSKIFLTGRLLEMSKVEIPPDLGNEFMLSWDDIREMAEGNITFGAHSVNHVNLVKMPLDQTRYEIVESKKAIESNLKKEVKAFSYPNGEFDSNTVMLLKESGFECAVSVWPGKLVSNGDHIYTLSRIGAVGDFSKLSVELCGLWGDLQRLIGRKQADDGEQ